MLMSWIFQKSKNNQNIYELNVYISRNNFLHVAINTKNNGFPELYTKQTIK